MGRDEGQRAKAFRGLETPEDNHRISSHTVSVFSGRIAECRKRDRDTGKNALPFRLSHEGHILREGLVTERNVFE